MSTSKMYDTEGQIHSLSLIPNAAFGLSSSSLSNLQTYVTSVTTATLSNSTIQEYLGTDWTAVWGPIVFSNNPTAASVVVDNAMGLFYSPGQNLLVVSVAGTNGNSGYDWMDENFEVGSTVSWQTVLNNQNTGLTVPSAYATAAISTGASNGLSALLGMQDSNNQTMLQALTAFLGSGNLSGIQLAVAGHSLGGALSSLVALFLYNTMQSWNTNSAVTSVNAWPTASPTPGESVFASYYGSLADGSNGVFTFTSKYNSIDVVPQAWQLSTMATIPVIYQGNIDPSAVVGPLVLGGLLATVQNVSGKEVAIQYTQISPSSNPRVQMQGSFSDTVNGYGISYLKNLLDAIPASSSLYTNYSSELYAVVCFCFQLLYQHTTAYYGGTDLGFGLVSPGLLNIGHFTLEYNTIKAGISPAGQSADELYNQVQTKMLGRYIKNCPPVTSTVRAEKAGV